MSFSLRGLGQDNKPLGLSFLCKVESPTEPPLRWLRGFPCTRVRQLCGQKSLVHITPPQTGHPDPLGLPLSVALWQSRPPKQEICYRTSIQRTKANRTITPKNSVPFQKFQIKRNVGPKDQHLSDQYLPDFSLLHGNSLLENTSNVNVRKPGRPPTRQTPSESSQEHKRGQLGACTASPKPPTRLRLASSADATR